MNPRTLVFLCLTASLPSVTFSVPVPFGVDYSPAAKNPTQEQNAQTIDGLVPDVQNQIDNMKTALAKPGSQKTKDMIEAAFGKNADVAKITDNVNKIDASTMKVNPITKQWKDEPSKTGGTNWKDPEDGTGWKPTNVEFGKTFYNLQNDHGAVDGKAAQVGTIIHEASHFAGATGDYVSKQKPEQMVKGNSDMEENKSKSGYTKSPVLPKTIADVNKDSDFTSVRDNTANMHDNAESYAIFASLCSQPGALPRRDVELFHRALLADNHAHIEHILRRNSCPMPTPAQRAAMKKAAAQKATAQKTTASGNKLKSAANKVMAANKLAGGAAKSKSAAGKATAPGSKLKSAANKVMAANKLAGGAAKQKSSAQKSTSSKALSGKAALKGQAGKTTGKGAASTKGLKSSATGPNSRSKSTTKIPSTGAKSSKSTGAQKAATQNKKSKATSVNKASKTNTKSTTGKSTKSAAVKQGAGSPAKKSPTSSAKTKANSTPNKASAKAQAKPAAKQSTPKPAANTKAQQAQAKAQVPLKVSTPPTKPKTGKK